ncbi:SPOR domain-containing protein [Bartonella sp. CB175]|uniref:SPOR domain-containing protein n=1 Tax=Bartonella sp. CB175 TaxID=3112256 RepID=UPI00300E3926
MSDNDRKDLQNPQTKKQDNELYNPVEKLTRIFNSNKQSGNNTQQPNPSTPQPHEIPSQDEGFDLSFLETEFENNLADDLPFDNQHKQWDLHSSSGKSTPIDDAFNSPAQNSFLSEEEHYSSPIDHDEEEILDALSPLPIQKNQPSQNRVAPPHVNPFFEKNEPHTLSENFFFDESNVQNNDTTTPTAPYEQVTSFSQQTVQQSNPHTNIHQNYDDNQNLYNTPSNHPYATTPVDQKNWEEEYYTNTQNTSTDANTVIHSSEKSETAENEAIDNFSHNLNSTQVNQLSDVKGFPHADHTTDYNQFYKENFLEPEINVEKIPEYKGDTQNQYANIEAEVAYNQDNLNDTPPQPRVFNPTQTKNFSSNNHARRNTPPPNVDTYRFTEEMVEKTGPIMVPEVPYTAPEYDTPIDNLKEEFSDVFNVGNVPEKNPSQQQDDILNEIFHQTAQNPETDQYVSTQEQHVNYFPSDNIEHYSSFAPNAPYNNVSAPSSNASAIPFLKTFTVSKIFTKGVIFLILITIGFIGYSHFLIPSQKNKNSLIIHADNTPFKFKQEATDNENNIADNLDIYKQATGQNEEQKNTQPFLIDTSEPLEDLPSQNQKESENTSSVFVDEPDVEDAVTKAINHTIPTREVQTVIVKKDGTTMLSSDNHTNTESADSPEIVDELSADQLQEDHATSSEISDKNSQTTEHNLMDGTDKIIAQNTSIPKIIPIPSPAKFNSMAQTHVASHSSPSVQARVQDSESYYVQVASQPTSALAQDSLRNIKFKFGYLIGSRPLNIQSALIPGKGTYYRVRIQTHNRSEAINLCEDIKNSGGSCFITR